MPFHGTSRSVWYRRTNEREFSHETFLGNCSCFGRTGVARVHPGGTRTVTTLTGRAATVSAEPSVCNVFAQADACTLTEPKWTRKSRYAVETALFGRFCGGQGRPSLQISAGPLSQNLNTPIHELWFLSQSAGAFRFAHEAHCGVPHSFIFWPNSERPQSFGELSHAATSRAEVTMGSRGGRFAQRLAVGRSVGVSAIDVCGRPDRPIFVGDF